MIDRAYVAEDRLLELMAASARGPRRNGLFALWLVVRQSQGVLPPDALSARAATHRLHLLERRLSSLSLPAPLRRALSACLRQLEQPQPDRVAVALQQLAAPAAETVGPAAGAAVAIAVRAARAAARHTPAGEASA